MKNLLLAVLSCIVIFTLGIGFMWHKDNFVYLPAVTSVENTNGITTLHTSTDTYIIEVSDNTF